MIVARQKRKENICEYLLYMWQVEDLLRAAEAKNDQIERLILVRYTDYPEQMVEIRRWYFELADMMRREGKLLQGHLDVHRIVLMQLEELHQQLLADPKEYIYTSLHYQILPAIIQLRSMSQGSEASDLETVFNAVYGYLTLRLKGVDISPETEKSIKQMSTFLAMLAHKWQERDAQPNE